MLVFTVFGGHRFSRTRERLGTYETFRGLPFRAYQDTLQLALRLTLDFCNDARLDFTFLPWRTGGFLGTLVSCICVGFFILYASPDTSGARHPIQVDRQHLKKGCCLST